MKVLVTGNAGFIGFHTAKRLLERGDSVVGFDSVNTYYEVGLKEDRLKELEKTALSTGGRYKFVRANLTDRDALAACFEDDDFDRVIHLAAQAGIHYSKENPHSFVESNLVGFTNILEHCRQGNIPHLTYASTSSVYGANAKIPFCEADSASHPIQFYAATKRANELMAHSYSHLYGLPTTGLRFFTVYGPWGRPDMALFRFTRAILNDEPITLYNQGMHSRDFTYIDDIVESVIRVSDAPATPDSHWESQRPGEATSSAPWRLLNIGNCQPVALRHYVRELERALGLKAAVKLMPLQAGDLLNTYADTSALDAIFGPRQKTPISEGIAAFVAWFRRYYEIEP